MIALTIIESRYPELYSYVSKRRKLMYLALAVKSFLDGDLQGTKSYLLVLIHNGLILRGVVVFVALTLFGQYVLRQMSLPTYGKSPIFVKLTRILVACLCIFPQQKFT